MTYLNIYESAARMIGVVGTSELTEDYEERAPYLLATFVSQCAQQDRKYRIANGLEKANVPHVAAVKMSDAFPLSDVFLPAAGYYLAAMLIMEENEDMSEQLFDRYCDALASIEASLPATTAPIKNKYPGLL